MKREDQLCSGTVDKLVLVTIGKEYSFRRLNTIDACNLVIAIHHNLGENIEYLPFAIYNLHHKKEDLSVMYEETIKSVIKRVPTYSACIPYTSDRSAYYERLIDDLNHEIL